MRRALSLFLVCLGLMAVPLAVARAVEPDEILNDTQLEARARALSSELRCLVCQNQSIDDSQADLAKDLRMLVRERLQAADTDDQVREYLVARYGDFILLQPPFKLTTWLLWSGPFVILVAGALTLLALRPRSPAPSPAPLSAEEQAALERLLNGG